MSLSERLEKAKKSVKPKFEQWIDALDEADRKALEAAAVDPLLTNRAIIDAISDEGYAFHKDIIAAWRKSLGFTR